MDRLFCKVLSHRISILENIICVYIRNLCTFANLF